MPLTDEYDSDEPVIEAIRHGNRFAFDELVRRHQPWVRGVAFGVLGKQERLDDVVQQVWTTVWERIGDLRDPRRWRSWLYRLTRNAALDAGREITRRRQRTAPLADAAESTAPSVGVEGALVRDELKRAVLQAIQALPAIYREPFVLRHVNGWSYREIAKMMNMPVDSVETRLVRARRYLRDWLKDKL